MKMIIFFIYLSGDKMKKGYMLFLLILSLCSFNFVGANKSEYNLELLGKVIYIDPGHGA